MRRLCTDSSCSYSGRSAWHAAGIGHGSWRTLLPVLDSVPCGNAGRDRAEVSRGRSSRAGEEAEAVKGRTRKYKEEP